MEQSCFSIALLQICAHFIRCFLSFMLVCFWHCNFYLGLFRVQRQMGFSSEVAPFSVIRLTSCLCVPTVAILYHALKYWSLFYCSQSSNFKNPPKRSWYCYTILRSQNIYTMFNEFSGLRIYIRSLMASCYSAFMTNLPKKYLLTQSRASFQAMSWEKCWD